MVNLSSRRKFRINSAKSFAHTPQLRASPRPSRPREGRAHLGWAAVPAGPPWARCAGSGGAPALPSLSPPGDSLAAPCSVPSRPESSKLRLSKYICVYIYTQIDARTQLLHTSDRHLRTLPEHPFVISPSASQLPFSIAEHCSKEMETSRRSTAAAPTRRCPSPPRALTAVFNTRLQRGKTKGVRTGKLWGHGKGRGRQRETSHSTF